jgi:hypothetical protein
MQAGFQSGIKKPELQHQRWKSAGMAEAIPLSGFKSHLGLDQLITVYECINA